MNLNRQPDGEVVAVMVVFNGIKFLQKGLDSLLRSLRGLDDLVVVDNGSTDDSYEYISTYYPQVAVLRTFENLGGAGGFNAGIKVALASTKCKYIWLLDNDIYLEEGALEPLLHTLEQQRSVVAAGSQICLYYHPEIIQEIGGSYGKWLGSITGNYRNNTRIDGNKIPPFEVDYLAACSMMMRAEAIPKLGSLNDFFIFYDDVEWGLRANVNGFKCYAVPSSVICHNYSGLKPLVVWREYYRKRNRCVCLLLYPPRNSKYVALWIYLIWLNYEIVRRYFHGDHVLMRIYSKALIDFLSGHLGKRIEPNTSESIVIPRVNNVTDYLIDVNKLGDAIYLLEGIRAIAPESKIFCTSAIRFDLEAKGFKIYKNLPKSAKDMITIIGDKHSIMSIIRARTLFRYSGYEIKRIKYKYLFIGLVFLGYVVGIVPALIFGTIQLMVAIKKRHMFR